MQRVHVSHPEDAAPSLPSETRTSRRGGPVPPLDPQGDPRPSRLHESAPCPQSPREQQRPLRLNPCVDRCVEGADTHPRPGAGWFRRRGLDQAEPSRASRARLFTQKS